MRKIGIAILAAGLGKRMNTPDTPKVLAEIKSKPLIDYVLETSSLLSPDKIVVIVGHHGDKVKNHVKQQFPNQNIEFALQSEQLGTGHAVMQTKSNFKGFDGTVIILCGDVPLLSLQTLDKFLNLHEKSKCDCSVLSSIAPEATGYGRIVRDVEGEFIAIVEEKDADPRTKLIKEINSGVYAVDCKKLFSALSKVESKNAQGEFYLTDIVKIIAKSGGTVNAWELGDFDEIQGINTAMELKIVEKFMDNM